MSTRQLTVQSFKRAAKLMLAAEKRRNEKTNATLSIIQEDLARAFGLENFHEAITQLGCAENLSKNNGLLSKIDKHEHIFALIIMFIKHEHGTDSSAMWISRAISMVNCALWSCRIDDLRKMNSEQFAKIFDLESLILKDSNDRTGVKAYLDSLPGYRTLKEGEPITDTVRDQHGYLTMQLVNLLDFIRSFDDRDIELKFRDDFSRIKNESIELVAENTRETLRMPKGSAVFLSDSVKACVQLYADGDIGAANRLLEKCRHMSVFL